jgi:transcriptional regulator with XRE-family HTH domain
MRREKGLSQQELADLAGVGQDSISAIETGKHEPHPRTLRKLAEVLDIEVVDFFREQALSGKVEPPAPGAQPRSLEWALAASDEEYSEWILNAAPHELHKTWILLSEYSKGLKTGKYHRFVTDRAQAATARFFRLNPPVAVRPRKTQVSADEENRESREVG